MALVLYSVSAHDDISVLWNKFAAGMSESKRGIIRNIDEYVRDEYGAVSVGALFRLQSNTIEEDIMRLGGKAGWVRSLEAIAGLEFKSCAPVPASALLALRPPLAEVTPSTSNTAHGGGGAGKFKHPKGERLGAYLKRTNQFSLLQLPKKELLEICQETTDFTGRLTYNDSREVASFVFKFVCIKFQDPGGCKFLFRHLADELKKVGIPFPNRGIWEKVLKERFRNGRGSKASVPSSPRPRPAPRLPSVLRDCLCPLRVRTDRLQKVQYRRS